MNRLAWRGTASRVASETATMAAKASGTLQAAGWPSSTSLQLSGSPSYSVQTTPALAPRPPARSPATAPDGVSPRHQMPSTSSGQNVDAATAKARPTARATERSGAASAAARGTPTAAVAATRNAVTPDQRSLRTSWARTPDTAMARPDDVERNAANAPAVTRPVSTSPAMPPSISLGSSRTTVSSASAPYARPSAA